MTIGLEAMSFILSLMPERFVSSHSDTASGPELLRPKTITTTTISTQHEWFGIRMHVGLRVHGPVDRSTVLASFSQVGARGTTNDDKEEGTEIDN